MPCPQCGSSQLMIEVTFVGKVPCNLSDEDDVDVLETVSFDSSWDDRSPCECSLCEWQGQVRHTRPLPGVLLEQVKRELETGTCEPRWRVRGEVLLAEIERLNSLLEKIAMVSQKASEPDVWAFPETTHAVD